MVVLVIIMIAMMGYCANSVNDAIEENENSYKDVSGKTSFAVNKTFENSYIKMTMTEVNINFTDYSQYISVKDGYKVLIAKFEVENIGENEQYISYYDFTCYADDVVMEEKYYINDNYEDIAVTINSGKKGSGYVSLRYQMMLKK